MLSKGDVTLKRGQAATPLQAKPKTALSHFTQTKQPQSPDVNSY